MNILLHFLNPLAWMGAYRFHRRNAGFEKSMFDLELFLYSKILKNDMLHYGYFEDPSVRPEVMSLEQLEQAQIAYAQNILGKISDWKNPVLDVGCGMGGLAKMILEKNPQVEVLTPNVNQIDYIRHKYPDIRSHQCKFEDFETSVRYGTVINSESLQYINLDEAFARTDRFLLPGGTWIIVDYFRLDNTGWAKTGHLLSDFRNQLAGNSWEVVSEQDITGNVLPTLAYANLYLDRFFIPIKHYAFEKLRYKKAWLYYMTSGLRESLEAKIRRERAYIDTESFAREKKYMLFVLKKKGRY